MAADFPELATGTTIAFGTTGFAPTVVRGSIGAASRPVVRTTKLNPTLASTVNQEGGHTSKPGKVGTLAPIVARIQWDVRSGFRVPLMSEAPETITVTFPDGTTLAGSGYIAERGEVSMEIDNLLECDVSIERSGVWTYT